MKRLKAIIIVAIIIGIGFMGYQYYMDPYRGTIDNFGEFREYNAMLSMEEAKQDLQFLYQKIGEKHVSTVDGIPEALEIAYQDELDSIKGPITVLELWQKSSHIIKNLEDAHSAIYYLGESDEKLAGLMTVVDGKFYMEHRMLGKIEILSINGKSIKLIYDRFLQQFSYENIYWAEARFPNYLLTQEGMKWLGIDAQENVEFEYIDADGQNKTIPLHFIRHALSDVAETEPFVSYRIDKENNLGIFTLNECNYNDLYTETVAEFFKEVKENEIENIAVDLRENLGGNSYVVNEFMHYLPVPEYNGFGVKMRLNFWLEEYPSEAIENLPFDNVFNGNVYVLTSKRTFSSATMFATILQDNNVAESIGEPSGNQPSAYGDIVRFQLPNSGLGLVTTFKQFTRPDSSKNAEKYLVPTYWVNEDLAIEKLIEIINE